MGSDLLEVSQVHSKAVNKPSFFSYLEKLKLKQTKLISQKVKMYQGEEQKQNIKEVERFPGIRKCCDLVVNIFF